MSALLWLDTGADEALDLGDPFDLYKAFAEMDHAGGMENYPELFGVVEATELQDDVDPGWLEAVRDQAGRFRAAHGRKLEPGALSVLDALGRAEEFGERFSSYLEEKKDKSGKRYCVEPGKGRVPCPPLPGGVAKPAPAAKPAKAPAKPKADPAAKAAAKAALLAGKNKVKADKAEAEHAGHQAAHGEASKALKEAAGLEVEAKKVVAQKAEALAEAQALLLKAQAAQKAAGKKAAPGLKKATLAGRTAVGKAKIALTLAKKKGRAATTAKNKALRAVNSSHGKVEKAKAKLDALGAPAKKVPPAPKKAPPKPAPGKPPAAGAAQAQAQAHAKLKEVEAAVKAGLVDVSAPGAALDQVEAVFAAGGLSSYSDKIEFLKSAGIDTAGGAAFGLAYHLKALAGAAPKPAAGAKFDPKDKAAVQAHVGAWLEKEGTTATDYVAVYGSHAAVKLAQILKAQAPGLTHWETDYTLKNLAAGEATTLQKPLFGKGGAANGPNAKLPDAARPDLTMAEKVAAQVYTSGVFREINKPLWEQKEPAGKFAGTHKQLQSAFDKLKDFPKPVKVYRGLRLEQAQLKAFVDKFRDGQKGSEAVVLPGYQSTSTGGLVSSFTGNVEMEIEAKRGLDLKPVTHYPHENELLLDHNSFFEVSGVEEVPQPSGNPRWRIKLRQL